VIDDSRKSPFGPFKLDGRQWIDIAGGDAVSIQACPACVISYCAV
jgi:hypothetical protein